MKKSKANDPNLQIGLSKPTSGKRTKYFNTINNRNNNINILENSKYNPEN